jgi:hypothetical protein
MFTSAGVFESPVAYRVRVRSWNAEKKGSPTANAASVLPRTGPSDAGTAPWARREAIGPASTTYPAAAGIIAIIVSRKPRENRSRTPSTCRSSQRSVRPGRSAVKIDTATIACGREKKMKAFEYTVYAPAPTVLARLMTIAYAIWFATTYTTTQRPRRIRRRTLAWRQSHRNRQRNPIRRREGHKATVIATIPSVVPAPSTIRSGSGSDVASCDTWPCIARNTNIVAITTRLLMIGAYIGAANRRCAVRTPIATAPSP